MFLTTNRVESIDDAFMSRIHLPLYYPQLSIDARRSIWKVFITKSSGSVLPAWLNREFLDQVATYDINGRQIKNIMRMTSSIAANDQRELEPSDILHGIEALESFESKFKPLGYVQRLAKRLSDPFWLSLTLSNFSALVATQCICGGAAAFVWWRFHRSSR